MGYTLSVPGNLLRMIHVILTHVSLKYIIIVYEENFYDPKPEERLIGQA